jgi:hypothetical protein
MSKSQTKGTRWASAVRDWLGQWFHGIERRSLEGVLDRGDIAGLPGVIVEAKCPDPRYLMGTIAKAVREASEEQANAKAIVGLAVVKRPGKSSPGEAYWLITPESIPAVLLLVAKAQGRSLDLVVAE